MQKQQKLRKKYHKLNFGLWNRDISIYSCLVQLTSHLNVHEYHTFLSNISFNYSSCIYYYFVNVAAVLDNKGLDSILPFYVIVYWCKKVSEVVHSTTDYSFKIDERTQINVSDFFQRHIRTQLNIYDGIFFWK